MVSARVAGRRRLAVALLVIAGGVNYVDRSAVSVANPLIRHDLHLSIGQMGLLLSAFAWSYGFVQIPAGALVDRYGPRRVLGWGLVVWSAAQIVSGFVASLPQLLWARVALGFGESPMYTGGTRVCAEWYSVRERSLPIAVFNSSASLGPAIAPALLTALMLAYGWRVAFIVVGGLGVAIAAAWVLLYRGPGRSGLSGQELGSIGEAVPIVAAHDWRRTGALFRRRITWFLTAGFFGVVYMTWLYATWLPGYLEDARHLSIARAGWLTSVPLTAGFLGALSAGFLINWLIARGWSPADACRRPVIVAMLAAGICTVGGALAPGVGSAVALISGGVFAANLASSAGWALGAVVVAPDEVAGLEAIQNVGGSLGGALAPIVTGFVVQATGSFVPAFVLAGVICTGTAAIYAAMRRLNLQEPGATVSPPLA